jgi:hypothetical protein
MLIVCGSTRCKAALAAFELKFCKDMIYVIDNRQQGSRISQGLLDADSMPFYPCSRRLLSGTLDEG